MTPTLHTPSLSLRQLTKATSAHVEWLNDPEVVKFSEQRHERHTIESVESYIKCYTIADRLADDAHIWGIHEIASGNHIGNITVDIDTRHNIAQIGILIGERSAWGKGYGTEAWRAIADWLLLDTGGNVRKIEAGCHANNIAMRRVFDHTGFKLEGERKLHFLWFGQPVGLVQYARFK